MPKLRPTNLDEAWADPVALARIDNWIREYIAMDNKLKAALAEARHQRDKAGRSEKGRYLAVLVTKLEEVVAWWEYVERQEPAPPVPGEGPSA